MLSKKVCQRCYRTTGFIHFKKYRNWTEMDEKHWKQGHLFCVLALRKEFEATKANLSIENDPPLYCPFHLEHMMETPNAQM